MPRTTAALMILLSAARPAVAACPSPERLEGLLASVPWNDLARVRRFAGETPPDLFVTALAAPRRITTARDGRQGFAVAVVDLPVADLWRAVNDEDHHGGYLVDRSAVLAGTPRGSSRILAQALSRWGVGRYWVDRVEPSADLYRSSGGAVWELTFEDDFAAVGGDDPRLREIAGDLPPVRSTRGAWALVPLGERCTLIDYFVRSDPGGTLAGFQSLVIRRALHDAVEGLLRMAREHVREPHPGWTFYRPDGQPLP
jgi:hypothetical protein